MQGHKRKLPASSSNDSFKSLSSCFQVSQSEDYQVILHCLLAKDGDLVAVQVRHTTFPKSVCCLQIVLTCLA